MPKRVDHHERRELIADALMRVAGSQGLESVSLRHVAAEAGVTAGMVQHYFPSKDAMMRFAMDTASARFEQRITAVVEGLGDDPSPRALIGAVLGALLPGAGAGGSDDAKVALAFMAYAATRPAAAADLERGNAGLREFVAGQLGHAIEQGTAPAAIDAESAAAALVALTDGLGVQMLSSNLPAGTAAAVLHRQLDLIFSTDQRRRQ